MELEAELQDPGLQVTGRVASVDAALALIDSNSPDLAVLDISLADRDSLPVAETLRARAIPFVFATGYGADMELPDDFAGIPIVSKPYQISDILQKLAEAEAHAPTLPFG